MLRLLALACLCAAAAAQTHYFCDSSPASPITETEFFLTTRAASKDASYQAGQTCEFNAESSSRAFLVEIQSFEVRSAVVTISSGGSTLFRGSSVPKHQLSITTPTKSLQVRFDATGDASRSAGVTLRVRAFDTNGCPSGWTYLYGNCFGTSNVTGQLDYPSAQRACNSMRSNLMELPSSYPSSMSSFVRLLPFHLKSYYTWIGLSDRTANGQYQYYWLSGSRYYSTPQISCVSGGSYLTCYSTERYGTIYERFSSYSIFMANYFTRYSYACSMPPGGTSYFYRVPDGSYFIASSTGIAVWVWGVVAGGVFVVGLIIVGIYSAMRSSQVRRSQGAASVVVSTGRVAVQPPSTSYPQQPYPQVYPQVYPTPPYPTGPALNGPPAYNAAINAGYGDQAFQAK